MIELDTPVTSLLMIGPVYAGKLKILGIRTVGDLLYHVPFRYDNFSIISKLSSLQESESVTSLVSIKSFQNIYTRSGKKIQKAVIYDDTGEAEAVWYNQIYLKNIIIPGIRLSLSGKISRYGHKIVFQSPSFEVIKQGSSLIHTARLVPVYPETEGITSKWLRSRISSIFNKLDPQIKEILPSQIIREYRLIPRDIALKKIHFPDSIQEAQEARKRLAFEELFILQLSIKIKKNIKAGNKVTKILKVRKFLPLISRFIGNLPFQLTNSQKQAVKTILSDLSKNQPMNRLLEGDVGSGKTIVAAIAMYLIYLNGKKSVFMAPTQILVNQHYETITRYLSPLGIRIGLATSESKSSLNDFDVLVGTHALITKNVKFCSLSLVIIDEQQRFGVEQRGVLVRKGKNPHILSMTATPIPRTIALTLYADLDLSVLDEMPTGRIPVKTWVIPEEKRQKAYGWIEKQIKDPGSSNQAYIVCPFIEESESLTSVKAAKKEYDYLKKSVFPQLKLDLMHGRLKSNEKGTAMRKFHEGKTDVLVSTPVIEVGLDIRNATIIVIEAAERFGLSQLHQLRGRVGRGDKQSYCLLFSQSENSDSIKRLKYLENCHNGPKLAEIDLTLRGAGEMYGTRQHGFGGLKIASYTDTQIIEQSKNAVTGLFTADPDLTAYPYLRNELQKYKISNNLSDY